MKTIVIDTEQLVGDYSNPEFRILIQGLAPNEEYQVILGPVGHSVMERLATDEMLEALKERQVYSVVNITEPSPPNQKKYKAQWKSERQFYRRK